MNDHDQRSGAESEHCGARRAEPCSCGCSPAATAHPDWVLDERTRKVGRQGVAQAREILRRVAPPDAVRRAS